MIIKKIKIEEYQKPLISKTCFGQKLFEIRKGWYIKIITEDIVGIGEAAPIPYIGNESHLQAGYALEGFSLALKDIDYDVSTEEILLLSEIHSDKNPSAKFAIQSAIYDVLSQSENQTISKFINSQSSDKININSLYHPDSTIDIKKTEVLKMKIHNQNIYDIRESIDKILNIYPENLKLRIDFNGALDLVKSIRICKELEGYEIDYLEQPLPAKNLVDLCELRMNTNILIGADESLTDFQSAEKIIEESAADVLVIKPTLSGGYDDIKKIVNLCKSEGIRWIMTSSFETKIAQTSILHLIASLNSKEYCGVCNVNLFADESLPIIQGSQCTVPSTPAFKI
jgi:o-succinylbenzoate synthase